MAAGSWKVFDTFKRYMADGTLDLDAGIFKMTLHTSAANLSTIATALSVLSVFNSVTGEIADGNGYSTSGKTLSAHTWSTGASGGVMRFDSTAVLWSANGGTISNIKFAVIWHSAAASSGRKLVCYSTLSTSQFDLTDTNRLTITPSASGMFELSGGDS